MEAGLKGAGPPAGPGDDDERAFLERSLADLDREYEAGDLDRRDYERLRARYERRLRGEGPPPRPPARPGLVAAAVAFVVVVAVAAGVLVARSAGRREDADTLLGPVAPEAPAMTIPAELARCRSLEGGEAIDCYTGYTDAHPDDPDGFVEFGLFAVNAGLANQRAELIDAGEAFLRRALDLDAGHVGARVNLAVLLDRTGRADEAAAECDRLEGSEVPADLAPLLQLACGPADG